MALSKDWREFLELLNFRGVDYVIVGAQSLAFHGRPRHTGDLDILVRATPHNARLVLALLNEFGFEQSSFKESDFLQPETNYSARTRPKPNRSTDQPHRCNYR